jgi:site-specific DNA-methyltransferase (adenine-specific)
MGESSRYFYSAKADRAEREKGVDSIGVMRNDGRQTEIDNPYQRGKVLRNHHPTVKPVDLMRWLVRLVCPPGGVVLDPYTGSGTTGVACRLEGFGFIGIELNPEYIELARQRIAAETPSLFTEANIA